VALAGLAGPVVITTEAAAAAAAAAAGGGGGGGAADSVSIYPSFHLPALQHYHKSCQKNEGKLRSSTQRNDGNRVSHPVSKP